MSLLQPDPTEAPSWLPPITLGALATMVVLYASAVTGDCCCCAAEAFPLGVLVAFLAWRRDPRLTPGQGFAVSFIACGLGSAVAALIVILSIPVDRAMAESAFRESMEVANREMPAGRKVPPEVIDQAVELFSMIYPYKPVLQAVVLTVLAGLCGLFTVLVLRARRPRAPPGAAA